MLQKMFRFKDTQRSSVIKYYILQIQSHIGSPVPPKLSNMLRFKDTPWRSVIELSSLGILKSERYKCVDIW